MLVICTEMYRFIIALSLALLSLALLSLALRDSETNKYSVRYLPIQLKGPLGEDIVKDFKLLYDDEFRPVR